MDREALEKWGQKSKDIAETMFSATSFVEKYIKLIEKFSTAENIFSLTKDELQNTIKDKNICRDILEKKTLSEAEEIIKKHEEIKHHVLLPPLSTHPHHLL